MQTTNTDPTTGQHTPNSSTNYASQIDRELLKFSKAVSFANLVAWLPRNRAAIESGEPDQIYAVLERGGYNWSDEHRCWMPERHS